MAGWSTRCFDRLTGTMLRSGHYAGMLEELVGVLDKFERYDGHRFFFFLHIVYFRSCGIASLHCVVLSVSCTHSQHGQKRWELFGVWDKTSFRGNWVIRR